MPHPLVDGGACETCGTPAEPGQEYCLACGSRVQHSGGPVAALRGAWESRLGRYPGDWIWASLLALLVAGGAAAAAIAATKDTGSGGPETVVATSPVIPAPPPPPPPVPKPRPRPATPPTPPPPAKLSSWPAKNGYTVVLSSIPARGSGRAEAQAKAKAALEAGFAPAGILLSGNFSSLHPGYYVVFSGIYNSLEEAQADVPEVSRTYPSAYARQITR